MDAQTRPGHPIAILMAESVTTKHEERMVASRTGILPVLRPWASRRPVKYAFIGIVKKDI